MPIIDDVITRQVKTTLSYATPKEEGLYNYFLVEPPAGTPASNETLDPHEVVITDLRTLAEPPCLDVEGFELVHFETSVGDIYDSAEREAVFNPEVEAFVRRHTGAAEVRVFFPFLRGEEAQRRMPGSITAPAGTVHVDYTHETGPEWFDIILGPDADRFRGRRFAVINLWRPINGPLRDRPLAVCDVQSMAPGDLMPTHTVSRADERGLPTADGAIFESYLYSVAHNPAHRWYYASDMQPNEALLLKNYDSQIEGVSRFSPHTAFNDPTPHDHVLPRASIEVRCLTIW